MKRNQQCFAGKMIILFLGIIMISCNDETAKNQAGTTITDATPRPQATVLNKLIGTWQSENGKSFERWVKNENGTFRSVVFSVKGKDTSWNEHADIYMENNHWVFENTVKDQNQGRAIKFVSSSISNNSVQFSNPAHDFPTDVNYTVPDANTVNAFIAGPNSKGGKDTIPFNYRRVK